jgi:hypothetical protein
MRLLLDRFLRTVGAGLIAWPFVACLVVRDVYVALNAALNRRIRHRGAPGLLPGAAHAQEPPVGQVAPGAGSAGAP